MRINNPISNYNDYLEYLGNRKPKLAKKLKEARVYLSVAWAEGLIGQDIIMEIINLPENEMLHRVEEMKTKHDK